MATLSEAKREFELLCEEVRDAYKARTREARRPHISPRTSFIISLSASALNELAKDIEVTLTDELANLRDEAIYMDPVRYYTTARLRLEGKLGVHRFISSLNLSVPRPFTVPELRDLPGNNPEPRDYRDVFRPNPEDC